jgi:phosphate transport system protein
MPHKHFDERLDELKQRLLRMSADIETLVEQAVQLTIGKGGDLTPQDIVEGDKDIDQAEVEVEELAIELLALHQPMATDLRVIVTILKINNDLERIGDHAVNIAEAVDRLNQSGHVVPRPPELEEMGQISVAMLRDALDAFVRTSADEALAVGRRDDIVDRLHESLFRVMLTHMTEHNISNCLSVILIGRNIERIADLAVNIAEDAYYMVRGITIRHMGEDLERISEESDDEASP